MLAMQAMNGRYNKMHFDIPNYKTILHPGDVGKYDDQKF